jgi:hypothetical protein
MNCTQLLPGRGGNVLLLSMRELAQLVAYCVNYEFEDVVSEVTGADRVNVRDGGTLEWSRRIYRYSRFLGGRRFSKSLKLHSTVRLERDYELFLPVFNHPHELYSLTAIPNWRQRCRFAACFLSEMWVHNLPNYLLELLAEFDHIFVGVSHPVAAVTRITGRPCTYLPLAADVLSFAPVPPVERVIDMCNIGRRSQVTHEALLGLAADRSRNFFYYYDTVAASGMDMKHRTFRVQNAREHRMLLANLMRRSQFCFAHKGFVNDPNATQGRDEISSRVYEGAAAGVIMLGEPPRSNPDFDQQFNWAETLIEVPFDCPEIGRILTELKADGERTARIRRNNLLNAALRHDWNHRLSAVYQTFGIPPTEGMLARNERLQALAASL